MERYQISLPAMRTFLLIVSSVMHWCITLNYSPHTWLVLLHLLANMFMWFNYISYVKIKDSETGENVNGLF